MLGWLPIFAFLLLVIGLVFVWLTSRGVPLTVTGSILLAGGIFFAWYCNAGSGEARLVQGFSLLIAFLGFLVFCQGFRQSILQAVKDSRGHDPEP